MRRGLWLFGLIACVEAPIEVPETTARCDAGVTDYFEAMGDVVHPPWVRFSGSSTSGEVSVEPAWAGRIEGTLTLEALACGDDCTTRIGLDGKLWGFAVEGHSLGFAEWQWCGGEQVAFVGDLDTPRDEQVRFELALNGRGDDAVLAGAVWAVDADCALDEVCEGERIGHLALTRE